MRNLIKGAFIGIALVIPGLSGSIFAVVVGLYDRLLAALNHFREDPRRHLRLLIPVGLGAALGILLSTKAILAATAAWPLLAYAFFTGLVLGIAPFVWRKCRQVAFAPWHPLLAVAGFAVIYGLARLGEGDATTLIAIPTLRGAGDFFTMLWAGAFSVALMAIPGISGSIMLMVIDQYGTVYNAVGQLGTAARAAVAGDWAGFGQAAASVALLLPFALGAAVGLLAVARLMAWLLARFEALVYWAVSGIVCAAVVILVQTGIAPAWPPYWLAAALQCGVAGALGIVATMFLDRPDA
ncbi:DUF368 domain-containing protein [Lacticaseibacillus parakribbianus]|uniref:DUF368 domain-containing protein n=1 Tax=Lacticaseibacillus parakribbianus TaxID=2970927 RepID=UPI0021CAF5D8|nr:DUF368 domain-containing protein [Lacticaseibacillus parakribbianus]